MVDGATLGHFPSIDEIEILASRLMTQNNVPGVSISIGEDEDIESLYLGQVKAPDGPRVSHSTIFRAASLSKPLFTFAVFKLIDEGILSLDTPLHEYLPERYMSDERVELITARHVITHSTGFPNWVFGAPLTIAFQPGTQFSYSGEGFGYLQKVVEHILDEDLESMMNRLVFDPLKMMNSTYRWHAGLEETLAKGHDDVGDYYGGDWTPDYQHSAATLLTTSEDYTKFFQLFKMRAETYEEELAKQMLQLQSDQMTWDLDWGWCLGLGYQKTKLGEAVFHWGKDWGCRNFAIRYLQQDITVTCLTNGDSGLSFTRMLLSVLMGEIPLFLLESGNL